MPTSESSPTRLAHRYAALAVVVIVVSCALAAGASGVARSAPVQARWVITDLGTLAGEDGTSFASGVNNRGQVVGGSTTRDGSYHAFLWQNGRMRDLGTLPGYDLGSVAAAINDRGQIAGSSNQSSTPHAFLWQEGRMRDLGTLGGKKSYATAINNRGQVVGTSTTKDGKEHAFLWQNGKMREIGDFWPADINDRGQIVGARLVYRAWKGPPPVLWENGTLRNLVPSGRRARASGINERSQVVGILGGFGDCDRVATWSRSSQLLDPAAVAALRRDPCAGGNHEVEFHAAINERGQVAATGRGRGYLWQNGKRLDLGTLPGGDRSIAVAINNRGQIVGASGTPHHWDPDRAVLWTPTTKSP